MRYKAIISDVDGTLHPVAANGAPSEAVVQAVRKVVQAGIPFCLASGRPFFAMESQIEALGLDSYAITDNGASIYDIKSKSPVWASYLPNQDAVIALKVAKELQLATKISCDHGGETNPKTIKDDYKVKKVSVHNCTEAQATRFIDQIQTRLNNVGISRAASYESKELVDIYVSNLKATKQHAVLKLAEILKLDTSEIIGVGDGENDFPLLMACGLKVAMGNAVQDLKDIADYVAPSVEKDGIVEVIEKYLLSE